MEHFNIAIEKNVFYKNTRMSRVSTTVETDFVNKSTTLTFKVEDVPVTVYTYKDGSVTLTGRNQAHTNNFETYVKGLQTVNEWIDGIRLVNPSKPCIRYFRSKTSLSKNNKRLSLKYYIAKSLIIRMDYFAESRTIKFFPRSEHTLSLGDFMMLVQYCFNSIKIMKNLNKFDLDCQYDSDEELPV